MLYKHLKLLFFFKGTSFFSSVPHSFKSVQEKSPFEDPDSPFTTPLATNKPDIPNTTWCECIERGHEVRNKWWRKSVLSAEASS